MTEPVWLNPEQLIEMNRNLVADTGETFFVRDLALLESAAASPQNHFHYTARLA